MILENINSVKDVKALKIKDLKILAKELRDYMISIVPRTGGHLASNLGVVELTLALIYVFDFPEDKLVWDVGHQSYVYKILTGRKEQFKTIRCEGGISGFPLTSESVYDSFNTGHSSTSVSAALGMARARDLKNEKNNIISVIGDGALTGGMAFEGLNDLGTSQTKLLVVLNDNEMSISKNVGGISRYLSRIRIRKSYTKFKQGVKTVVRCIPLIGKPLYKVLHSSKDNFKMSIIKGKMFEQIGLNYIGPVDGHDIKLLIDILESCKYYKKPIILHAVTKKGKGLTQAEKNPTIYHGIQPWLNEQKASYSKKACEELISIATDNPKITAITAAMKEGTGLNCFAEKFPDRFFDVGIAEQHAVTLSAGLAVNGLKPYFFVYSTFLQRAYDQILHDVCLQNLPVTFCLDRAGINGSDGATHQGIYDIAYLRSMPNMSLIVPANISQLVDAIRFSENYNAPLAIRYPKDCILEDSDFALDSADGFGLDRLKPLEYGKWQILKNNGGNIWLLASGDRMLKLAKDTAKLLSEKKIAINIVNACFIKPIDIELLYTIYDNAQAIVCLEDGVGCGGLYSAVLEQLELRRTLKDTMDSQLQKKSMSDTIKPLIIQTAIPDKVVTNLSVEGAFQEFGLTSYDLANKIEHALKN